MGGVRVGGYLIGVPIIILANPCHALPWGNGLDSVQRGRQVAAAWMEELLGRGGKDCHLVKQKSCRSFPKIGVRL